MTERGKQPPSLRDFDYFGDKPATGGFEPHPDDDDDHTAVVARQRRQSLRRLGTLLITLTFLSVTGWFMWGYVDVARYAFSTPREALQLGEVTEILPEQIPHNEYVAIHGITEHRGLHQIVMRGLTFEREDYWYFRLLGSRGVFIEVVPDGQRYGTTTEVTVAGRAVDPRKAPFYDSLLKSYQEIYAAENRPETRVIQVGLKPGENRAAYVGALGILGTLALLNLVAMVRLLRSMFAPSSRE